MKKFAMLLLVLSIGMFSVVGCGDKKKDSGGGGDSGGDTSGD